MGCLPSINWCRISSIHSMSIIFEWPEDGDLTKSKWLLENIQWIPMVLAAGLCNSFTLWIPVSKVAWCVEAQVMNWVNDACICIPLDRNPISIDRTLVDSLKNPPPSSKSKSLDSHGYFVVSRNPAPAFEGAGGGLEQNGDMRIAWHMKNISQSWVTQHLYCIYIPCHIITIINLIIITIMIVTIVITSTTTLPLHYNILHIVHCIIKPVYKDLQFAGTAESRWAGVHLLALRAATEPLVGGQSNLKSHEDTGKSPRRIKKNPKFS